MPINEPTIAAVLSTKSACFIRGKRPCLSAKPALVVTAISVPELSKRLTSKNEKMIPNKPKSNAPATSTCPTTESKLGGIETIPWKATAGSKIKASPVMRAMEINTPE